MSKDHRSEVDAAIDEGKGVFEISRKGRWPRYALDMVGALAIILALWSAALMYSNLTGGVAFPTPLDVGASLWGLLAGDKLLGASIYQHTIASMGRWALGYGIAVLLGIVIGLVLGTTGWLYGAGMNSTNVYQLIPGLAWIPIAILLFGIGNIATVFIIVMTALPPVVIATASGLRSVPPVYLKVADMLELGPWDRFRLVLLPSSALQVLTGLRVALGNAWRVLIAAEMVVGVAMGLGFSIFAAQGALMWTESLACIVIICLIGLLFERLVFTRIEDGMRSSLGLEG